MREAKTRLGLFLREERRRQDMTTENLAKKVGVSRQTCSNWETGNRRPRRHQLGNIARILKVDPEILRAAYDDQEIPATTNSPASQPNADGVFVPHGKSLKALLAAERGMEGGTIVIASAFKSKDASYDPVVLTLIENLTREHPIKYKYAFTKQEYFDQIEGALQIQVQEQWKEIERKKLLTYQPLDLDAIKTDAIKTKDPALYFALHDILIALDQRNVEGVPREDDFEAFRFVEYEYIDEKDNKQTIGIALPVLRAVARDFIDNLEHWAPKKK